MQFLDGPDRRRYNAPFVNEVAAIFASSDGAPPEREFVLHKGITRHSLLKPPSRSPFLSMSHSGPCVTLQQNKRTMREFTSTAYAILESGLLFQQFLIDSYYKIEQNNIYYLR